MQEAPTPPICEVVILTALGLEYKAVSEHIKDMKEITHQGTIYGYGNFTGNHRTWHVAVTEIGMGGPTAAAETERAISYFQPQITLFVGIGGGLKDVKLGHVVAASKVYAYELGKVGRQFQPRPEAWRASHALEQRARAEARNNKWLTRLGDPYPNPVPEVHIGALAAGEKVLASTQSDLFHLLKATYGDALAVEMEGHGFLAAVHANQGMHALIIRGISDLIDDKSSSDTSGWQTVAAQHAAAFAFQILARFTLPELNGTPTYYQDTSQKKAKEKNRQRVLDTVQSNWITGYLEAPSTHQSAYITLSLREDSTLVHNPWQDEMQEIRASAQPFPLGTSILQVYEQAQKSLLLLGEPGAGKTSLLLVLARDLLNRAKKGLLSPVPMVFNLSSWPTKYESLNNWIIKQCKDKYLLQEEVAQSWIEGNEMILLLDGLDEVSVSHRASCTHAINIFHQEYPTISIVVCGRLTEYLASVPQLRLQKAILIEPLTGQQIDEYLTQTDLNLEGVRRALKHDTALRELAITPLMLDILVRTYHGRSMDDIALSGSLEDRHQQIFTTYIQRMLQRRQKNAQYTQEQVVHWLSWLASYLAFAWQADFSFEDLQPAPAFLGDLSKLALYRSRVSLTMSGLTALTLSFIAAVTIHNFLLIILSLVLGWLFGGSLVSSAAEKDEFRDLLDSHGYNLGLKYSELRKKTHLREIEAAESISWSWKSVQSSIALYRSDRRETSTHKGARSTATFWCPIVISLGGVAFIMGLESVFTILSFSIWIIFSLGLHHQKEKQSLSAKHVRGILSASITGLFAAGLAILIAGLILDLFSLQYTWLHSHITSGWLTILVFGYAYRTNVTFSIISPSLLFILLLNSLLVVLPHGWLTAIQRFFLHLFLQRMDYIPPNCCDFFDYAVERVLLRRSGNGWAFHHRLLQEYFTMQNTDDNISAEALSELAGYYNEQEQPERALILLQRALRCCEQKRSVEDGLLPVLLNNLCWTYQNLGRPKDALPFAQRSVTLRERLYGSDDEITIRGLWRLAEVYYALERYEEAEPAYERTLAFFKQQDRAGMAVQTIRKLVDLAQRKVDLAQRGRHNTKDF